ncbi:hypothetical protein IMG5_166200, partial [Ichthyophthirius multifiliis]
MTQSSGILGICNLFSPGPGKYNLKSQLNNKAYSIRAKTANPELINLFILSTHTEETSFLNSNQANVEFFQDLKKDYNIQRIYQHQDLDLIDYLVNLVIMLIDMLQN